MRDYFSTLLTPVLVGHLIATLVVLVAVFVGRWLVLRRLRDDEIMPAEQRRRWMVQARNGAMLVLVLALVLIWAEELRAVALSLVMVAAAAVLALKELIMCLTGGLVRARGRAFDIGDRIQVGDWRGDVIDQAWLTTRLMEVGPGRLTHQRTGRMVTLPNSLFLSQPVTNESAGGDYLLHAFPVPLAPGADLAAAEALLLELANAQCAGYLEKARRRLQKVARAEGLEPMQVEPRIRLQLPEADRPVLVVRMPVTARDRGSAEQAVLRGFLAAFPPAAARP